MKSSLDYFEEALKIVSKIDEKCEFGILLKKDVNDEYNEVPEVCAAVLEFMYVHKNEKKLEDDIELIRDNYGSEFVNPAVEYFTKTLLGKTPVGLIKEK